MTLHEKGISFHTQEENLKDMSQNLRKLHPEAKVPVLIHGETALYESAVITEYIDDIFPDPPLMPTDPKQRAQVRLWTYWCNHIFKPHLDAFKYGESRSSKKDVAASVARLSEDLKKLEKQLQRNVAAQPLEKRQMSCHIPL